MGAARHGHIAVVRMLLNHGADVHKRCMDGTNAHEVAITQGYTKVSMDINSRSVPKKSIILL